MKPNPFFASNRFSLKPYALLIVDTDDLYFYFLPHLDCVFHLLYVSVRHLGYMEQPVLAGEHLYEGAVFLYGSHLPFVDLPDPHLFRHSLYDIFRLFGVGCYRRRNNHGAVVFYLNPGARILLNPFHVLAAGPYHKAYLVRIYLYLQQPWGVVGNTRPGFVQHL